MTDTRKITASFTFRGQEFKDVECVNPGGWFGKTWLMEIGGSCSPFFVVVEADTLSDAIDELIDSKYGAQFIIDPADYGDYNVDSDSPSCSFAGNNGHPVDLEHLAFHGDDRDGFPCLYNVEGWPAPVKPTNLRDVEEKMEERDAYRAQVASPGKFEGEAAYVPYFWESDCADDEDRGVSRYDVSDEDRLMFPELEGTVSVYLHERSDGCVCELGRPAEPGEYFGHDDEWTESEDDETDEDAPTFSVIEYSSFYAVRHNPSGEEHPMGDGVDTLFDDDGVPLSPGTEEFRKTWEDSLNSEAGDTLEAYFPHLVDED